ncbi:membrane-spanning 4-domains subfamily A member 12 isoform X1 [Manis javanica]|uniref:membrane-spanning 4-domains subfamily A member 12 isoform X1 n=1 Tax=Manis javanica TaxID=9974 RepID=UPI003C6D4320
MTSSNPTTNLRMYETTLNPFPQSNSMAPGPQQLPGFINLGNQVHHGPPPFIPSLGAFTNYQQGQGNIQMANPATGIPITKLKEEAKILGGIQIMIGVMHIGFGIILGLMNIVYSGVLGFASLTFISGYPFWGGVSFIIAGALSISAAKQSISSLIKSSVGLNIVGAIFAFIGVILLLVDVSINGTPSQDYWAVLSGKGISGILIIFSVLEFCITCTTVHFACQATTNTNRQPVLVIPNVYATNP